MQICTLITLNFYIHVVKLAQVHSDQWTHYSWPSQIHWQLFMFFFFSFNCFKFVKSDKFARLVFIGLSCAAPPPFFFHWPFMSRSKNYLLFERQPWRLNRVQAFRLIMKIWCNSFLNVFFWVRSNKWKKWIFRGWRFCPII